MLLKQVRLKSDLFHCKQKKNLHLCFSLTQVIFIQVDLLHHRGHDERESLPVKEVQRVADEHAEEDDDTIVAVARGPHDCC